MKIHRAVLTAAALAVAVSGHAQSERGKAEATVAGKKVVIDYGRPSLKGRDMLAQAPAGTVWRMGANEATTIQCEGDLVFGKVTIPKGSASLFARRVDEKTWELVFNKQTGQWGTRRDPAQDFASVPLTWEKQDATTEVLTIEVSAAGQGGEFKMMWGPHILKTSFVVK